MAKYIILNQENATVGLAETDIHKTVWSNISGDYNFVQLTDDQFTKIKTDTAAVTNIESNTVTLKDCVNTDPIWTEQTINEEVNNIKNRLTNFINGHPNSQLKTDAENYLNYLNDTFNVANITFPNNQNIHQYLNNNNINFLHPLQIP